MIDAQLLEGWPRAGCWFLIDMQQRGLRLRTASCHAVIARGSHASERALKVTFTLKYPYNLVESLPSVIEPLSKQRSSL